MTSLPQTQQRAFAAQDSRRRTSTAMAGIPETPGTVRVRVRQALPAVDPSKEFGCVDWFLYPDAAAAEVAAKMTGARAA